MCLCAHAPWPLLLLRLHADEVSDGKYNMSQFDPEAESCIL